MTAHLDFATLSLHLDLTSAELKELLDEFGRGTGNAQAQRLMAQILHELCHLCSFLGSPIAGVHKEISEIQTYLSGQLLATLHGGRLVVPVDVPLFDRGRASPRAFETPELKRAAQACYTTWQQLETLDQFMTGYSPMATKRELLLAYRTYLAYAALPYGVESLVGSSPVLLGPQSDAAKTLCFMRDTHDAVIRPQLADPDWTRSDSPDPAVLLRTPVLTKSCVTIAARSVLEGLAVVGELIAARTDPRMASASARASVPDTYRAALAYSLDCLNSTLRTTYTVEALFAGSIPPHVTMTIGMILDFAMQIEDPGNRITSRYHPRSFASNSPHHSALIEKSPAWRLLLIGAAVEHEPHAFVLPEGCEFDDHDLREWGYMMSQCMNWDYVESRGLEAAAALVDENSGLRPISHVNLFEHMASVGALRRSRNRLTYLRGSIDRREGEWLDFVTWQTKDRGQWFPDGDHVDARKAYVAEEERRHYGLGAMMFGRNWDYWWLEQHEAIPQKAADYISNMLVEFMALWGIRQAGEREAALTRSFDVQVRRNYNWVP